MSDKFNDNREEVFKKPEFMAPAEVAEVKSVVDGSGKPWCIFGSSASWAITPASAKLRIDGRVLNVAIRLRWADDKEFLPPVGEVAISGVWKVAELEAFRVEHPRLDFFAFPLPTVPDTIHVT